MMASPGAWCDGKVSAGAGGRVGGASGVVSLRVPAEPLVSSGTLQTSWVRAGT